MAARSASRSLEARRRKVVRRREVLELGDGLRLAVVADTHSQPHPRAHELIARERPDCILHAGDIGNLAVLADLEAIAPTWAVRGNIDARTPGVPDVLRVDIADGEHVRFTMVVLHIALAGRTLRADAVRLAHEEDAALIVCGHSHIPFIGRDRDLGVFNPGSIGPRRFHLPIVFGVMDISRERISMKHVDCETGEVWAP